MMENLPKVSSSLTIEVMVDGDMLLVMGDVVRHIKAPVVGASMPGVLRLS